ncbi:MAG: hypothetical protein DRJ62_05435 [Thermoprotei archaeon]|nr:MAG: hypothetical protein DRJ62_05435 [Thermoprotei archaeon]
MGGVLIAPIIVALIYSEFWIVPSFVIPLTLSLGFGLIIYKQVGFPVKLTLVDAMVISSVGWLITGALGSIPYLAVLHMNPLDAYFEAFSSLTATGMTLIPELEAIPKSILFWRALGQWLGGAGVVLLTTLLLLGKEGIIAWRLYIAEAREERFAPTIRDTIKNIWMIYTFYTVLCALVLMMLGLQPFDAVCHSLTCLSTGGFSTRTDNVGAFNNPMVEVALMVFMVLGAIRFSLHYRLFRGGFRNFVKDLELRIFLAVLIVASLVVSVDLAFVKGMALGEALRLGFFHTFSVGTTTGFTTQDIAVFPPLSQFVLLVLMLVGGCMNSTAGGVKMWRMAALMKLAKQEIEKALVPPEAVRSIKLSGSVLKNHEVVRVLTFFFIYLMFAFGAAILMTLFEHNIVGSLSGIFSAMATVGPFYMSTLTLTPASKVILIISMWAGRLELIPVLLLFTPRLWRGMHRHQLTRVLQPSKSRISKLICGL